MGDLEKRLAEALQRETQASKREAETQEQQAATVEILRVISNSPADAQPVFDAIAVNALRLCDAYDVMILRMDGDVLSRVAHHGPIPPPPERVFAATRDTVSGRTVLDGRPIHVADLQAETEEFPVGSRAARQLGFRTVLSVPLLRDGVAIGVIHLRRTEVQPFTESQIALLQTFADQAVIAIENVRLFNEAKEALEQQTATADILRVISRSPSDIQPVFDAIASSATRLCEAVNALIVRFDGQLLHLVAHHNVAPERLDALERLYPGRANRGGVSGRVVLTHAVVHVEDVDADPEYTQPQATTVGYRTALGVPMLREGVAIGLILVARDRVAPFSGKQIALLQTFADQAVIAIENVRLFTELEARNRDLSATSEILRVISRSPTDIQPVMNAVAENAARLCDAEDALIQQIDGDVFRVAAHFGTIPVDHARTMPVGRNLVSGRAALERTSIHVHDMLEEGTRQDFPVSAEFQRRAGFRTLLATPLMREATAIGAIVMRRLDVRPFTDKQIALLQTFADQAVIAIGNVRLFKELEARTADLTRSVDQLTALGEVDRAVSSTLDLETVLTTIVSRAVELSGLDGGVVLEYDEGAQEFVQRAQAETGGALAAARRATRIRRGDGVVGRTAITLEPV